MTTPQMDERFAAGLRAALVEHVHRAPVRERRRRRTRLSLGALVAVGLAGGGVALATQDRELRGMPVVTALGATHTVTHTGGATIDLGTPPAGTNSIQMELTCLTAGSFRTPDGAGLVCQPPDFGAGGPAIWTQPLASGQHTITIRTGANGRWSLRATYSATHVSPWGVDGSGQTYGVGNADGQPDLIAVIATNGQTGYAYWSQVQPVGAANPTQALEFQKTPLVTVHVPVYLADGKTRIGQFDMQEHEAYLHARGATAPSHVG